MHKAIVCWLSCALLVACSAASGGDGAPAPTPPPAATAAPDTPPVVGPRYPAFTPPPAQVVSRGGPILAAPKIQTILFDGDAHGAIVDAFVAQVGASSYWSATTAEYGVGPATALPTAHLAETLPSTIDDASIKSWLADKLDGTHPDLAPPDKSTVYVIVYPEGVTIMRGTHASCGAAFGGYHGEAKVGAGSVPYVVVPRCATYLGQSGDDELTLVTSHELVEAALNPLTDSAPAYDRVDDAHVAFSYAMGDEPGDLCALPVYAHRAPDLDFVVQRTWSNAAAKAGHHPCVPAGAGAYFAAAPALTDQKTVAGSAIPVVSVPVGETRTIDLDLFSDAPTGDWSVDAIDVASAIGGKPAELSLSLDRTTGHDGDVLRLTIQSISKGQAGSVPGLSAFIVRSRSGSKIDLWAAFVAN